MTKLRKRMILLKTNHFLKENQLILFYHESHIINIYNKTNISPEFLKKKEIFEDKRKKLHVKNKIAIRAFRSAISSQSQPILTMDNPFHLLKSNLDCQNQKIEKKNFLQRPVISIKNDTGKINAKFSTLPDKVTALLQGGTVIMGANNLSGAYQNIANFFEKNESENVLLMGGIYQNKLVNVKLLKRLYSLGEEKKHYQNLTIFLRKNSLRLFLKCHPFQSVYRHAVCLFSCLRFQWILLIYLLKNYSIPRKSNSKPLLFLKK